MMNRTLIPAVAAPVLIAVGLATSFFELIVLGAIAAVVALVLAVKRQPGHDAPER
jgi:hypothetical protein